MGSDDSETEKHDRVLAPEDLDITQQPEVAEIDDGRYVVSPSGPAKTPDKDLLENPDWLTDADDEDADAGSSSRDKPPQRDQSGNRGQQPPAGNQSGNRGQQPPAEGPPGNRGQQPPSGGQSGNRGQQPPAEGQSGNRGQQPPAGGQSGNRGQQPPAGGQSGNRGQQPPAGGQSGNRSQQPPAGGQSGDRGQQPPAGNQPRNRGQQSPAANQSSNRGQQPPAGNQSAAASSSGPASSDLAAHDQPPVEPPAVELTNENVSKFLAKELTQGSGDYGFDATLNVEGQVNRGRMTSDDVGETLETLLRWYARQTTDEVEPEAVLGIILAGTDLAVEYPVQSAYAMVKQFDLKPDDSISDLLAAIRNEGSFTVPPSKD